MLKIAYVSPWNTLHPGLQHTLMGDLVLSNQFEALVGMNNQGVGVPLAAKSWVISRDFKTFTFKIDTSKTFSDGEHLSSKHFKQSWESALALEPVSANSSLLDVLYKVEGFDSFKRTGHLSGLVSKSDEIFEIHFSSPFRMALEHLQGNRFAAFKPSKDGTFIGTGVYEIIELSKNELEMRPRKNSDLKIPLLKASYMKVPQAIEGLKSGTIDVIPFIVGFDDEEAQMKSDNIEIVGGQDAVHLSIGLNSFQSSVFTSKEMRQAFQTLIWDVLKENPALLPDKQFFNSNSQVFMPFQSGVLDEKEADALIEQGRSHINELRKATDQHPITVKYLKSQRRIFEAIKRTGLKLSEETSTIEVPEYFKLSYAKQGPDVVILGFGITSGDPDGVYHKLGPQGAIRTPYVYSEIVGELLEKGRKIVDIEKINGFYQGVSRSILTEVPMVHIGFAKAVMAFDKSKVTVDSMVLRRNAGQLHILRAL